MSVRLFEEGSIGRLVLDRPSRANAYDRAMLGDLRAALNTLEETARLTTIVVEARGDGAFCGGADLASLEHADPLAALDLESQALFTRLARLPQISIAAVHGAAVAGGFELALACDLRVVGPAARFSLPETALGLIPSAGGCTRLTRAVGPSRAKEVILAGKDLDAGTAVRWGLAMAMADDPRAEALEVARRVSRRDPVALRLARAIIDPADDDRSLQLERVSEALLYARKRLGGGGQGSGR